MAGRGLQAHSLLSLALDGKPCGKRILRHGPQLQDNIKLNLVEMCCVILKLIQ